jgi:protein-S-isoprenylcysteine O-methyltransferase Ste14
LPRRIAKDLHGHDPHRVAAVSARQRAAATDRRPQWKPEDTVKRFLTIGYGAASYLIFLGAFLYAIGFVGNIWVPRSIDAAVAASIGEAVTVNVLLLGMFAVQHSVMARPAFKRWWTRFVHPSIERSTYVLLASLVLIVLYWQWRTMPAVVWDVASPAGRLSLLTLFWLGWATVLAATFMINHFDLFGLRQVYLAWRGKPYTQLGFRTLLLYRLVRHPIMVGFIVAFWATPKMTAGHLLFASATTAYILIAVQLEEHDLVAALGDEYRDYRDRVPMFLPRPHRRREPPTPRAERRPA